MSVTFGSLSQVPSDKRDYGGRHGSIAGRNSIAGRGSVADRGSVAGQGARHRFSIASEATVTGDQQDDAIEEKEEGEGDGESSPSSSSSSLSSSSTETDTGAGTREHRNRFASYVDPFSVRGRMAGGTRLQRAEEASAGLEKELGKLTELHMNFPLTLTETTHIDGKEVILLYFAPEDPENPFNWPESRKTVITVLLCSMTIFIGLATTAYSSGMASMVDDLGTSMEMGELGLFLFNMVCALGPLFLAPFCELVGRRVIYVGAYLCFSIMFIGLALGRNIGTILVCRALLGLFGCVGTILVGGTFSDMYVEEEMARPMAFFTWAAIVGTVGAPIYAGYIDMKIGWRWIEGIQGLSNIPLLLLVFFFLRESRGSVTLHKRAKILREALNDDRYMAKTDLETASLKQMLHTSSVKAVKMLVTEPVVLAFGLWIAFAWGVTFLFLSVIPITFSEKRGWNEGISGLPYISLVVGVTLGYFANFLQIRKHESILKDPNRQALPEDRLYGAMFGAIWLPIGLFIYSFTQYGYVLWVGPAIALAPISFGIFFIFESVYSVTADCYGKNASSAIAGQGFLRNTLGAVTPLFGSQFFHNVHSQYAGLLLACVALALTSLPFIMFRYGHVLRERSTLAQKY